MIVFKRNSSLPNNFITASEKHFVGNARTHVHEFFEIEYVIGGTGTCVVDGREYPLEEGSVFLLSPVNTHEIKKADAKLINVMFKCAYCNEINTALPLIYSQSTTFFSLSKSEREFVRTLLSEIVSVCESNEKYARMLLQCVLEKLCCLCSERGERKELLPYIRKALIYITENFRCGITLESTAEHLGLSPTYFSELFSREIGASFKSYLDTLRFSHAKELLAFSSLPISEIHTLAGFDDYANFSRRFKKKYGITPSEYRQNAL